MPCSPATARSRARRTHVRRVLGVVVDRQRLLEQHLPVLERAVGVRVVPRDQLAHRPDRGALGRSARYASRSRANSWISTGNSSVSGSAGTSTSTAPRSRSTSQRRRGRPRPPARAAPRARAAGPAGRRAGSPGRSPRRTSRPPARRAGPPRRRRCDTSARRSGGTSCCHREPGRAAATSHARLQAGAVTACGCRASSHRPAGLLNFAESARVLVGGLGAAVVVSATRKSSGISPCGMGMSPATLCGVTGCEPPRGCPVLRSRSAARVAAGRSCRFRAGAIRRTSRSTSYPLASPRRNAASTRGRELLSRMRSSWVSVMPLSSSSVSQRSCWA